MYTDIRDHVLATLKPVHLRLLEQAGALTHAQAVSELPGEPGHAFAGDFYHLVGGYDQTLAFLVNDGLSILERDFWDDRLGFDIATPDDDPLFLSLTDEQWTALKEYGAAIFAEVEAVLAAIPAEQLAEPVPGTHSNDPMGLLLISYMVAGTSTHAGELSALYAILVGKRPDHH